LKPPHLNHVAREPTGSGNGFQEKRYHNEDHEDLEGSLAGGRKLSPDKHHWKQDWNRKQKKNQYENQYMGEYQYDRYRRQTQQGSSRQQAQQPSVSKCGDGGHDSRNISLEKRNDNVSNDNPTTKAIESPRVGKPKKDYKRVSNPRPNCLSVADLFKSGKTRLANPPQQTHILLPKGETGHWRNNITERQKHPRLRGADLYVTRIGWGNGMKENKPKRPTTPSEDEPAPDLSSPSRLPSRTSSGSLHDELRDPSPRLAPQSNPSISDTALPCSVVHASRPCYRRVSYMHSVGIKRVFWTNDDGKWECAKVAELVQALECAGDGKGEGGPLGNGVFVTMHEVLMLKRMMG